MRTSFYIFTFVVSLLACNQSKSQKGTWDENDKKSFALNCTEKYAKDEAIKAANTNVKQLCDCMLEKAEKDYANPKSIDKDAENKLLETCFTIK
ncbi:MAG: hypothetical protein SFU27_11210 [Thermonemataceae bacterium]|nr:hypothetical protein [Thermonemataceae bacterium]